MNKNTQTLHHTMGTALESMFIIYRTSMYMDPPHNILLGYYKDFICKLLHSVSMEGENSHFAVEQTQEVVTAMEMNFMEQGEDTTVVMGEQQPTVLISTMETEGAPPSLQDVWRALQSLTTLVNTVLKNQEDLQKEISDLSNSSILMKESLKVVEIVLCTSDVGTKTGGQTHMTDNVNSEQNECNDGQPAGATTRVHVSANKRKSVTENNDDDPNNVIVQVSDDDDENNGKKQCTPFAPASIQKELVIGRPQIPLAWTKPQVSTAKKEKSPAAGTSWSDYRRTTNIPNMEIDTQPPGIINVAKRLFQTPSPSPSIMKQPRQDKSVIHASDIQKTPRTGSKGKNKKGEMGQTIPKESGGFFPKGIKWKFKPSPDMLLSLKERQTCAFLYHPQRYQKEILVSSRGLFANRADFDCLIPGRAVSNEIMTLHAEKIYWDQKIMEKEAVWCFPPTFADDVFRGRTLYELLESYCNAWMEPFRHLKYIYIPIKDNCGHWFMMVVSIPHKEVYHLDSFLQFEDIAPRRKTISSLCDVLSQMIASSPNAFAVFGHAIDFRKWPIKEPRGIPNCGSSDNSVEWVLQWMALQDSFNPFLNGMIHQNSVRMKTAMGILLGLHNELKSYVEEKALAFWDTLPRSN